MKIDICGIPHQIIEKADCFDADASHLGQIDYRKATILLNEDMTDEIKKATLCHEVLHGMLVHIGRNDLSEDEQFVMALGNAINASFEAKVY